MGTVVGQAVAAPDAPARPSRPLEAAMAGLVSLLLAMPVLLVAVDGVDAFEGFVAQLHLFSYVVALSFAVVAVLVERHESGNRLALLAAAIAFGFATSSLCDRYGVLGHERDWPGIDWVVWISRWFFVPAMWAIPTLLVTLFPSGRVPSARWRPFVALTSVAILVGTAGWALTPYGEIDMAPQVPVENPVASDLGTLLVASGGALWALAAVVALAGLGARIATAKGGERFQLLWLLLGIAGAVVASAAGIATGDETIPSLGIVLLPTGIAIGVVRHGLWDVRIIVQRSLVYGALLAAIVAVYAVTVAVAGDVLGREVGAPLLATGVVALGVQPARDRAQRLASRLLYGDREDPYTAVSRLGERLDAAADRDGLLTGVVEALVRVMRLRGAAVTVDDVTLARVGDLGAAPQQLALVAAGEPVGTLLVGVHDGDELSGADQRLLAELARHVSSVVRAERLAADLAASRARLVTAREEERRRIRRDLHDELGPTLAAIANDVERAALEVGDDPDAASARLDDVAVRVRSTVGDVRALVEGLHPTALDHLGLEGALRDLVRRLGSGPVNMTVEVDGDVTGLPAAVEVNAYRIAAEAMANAARHSRATSCRVTVTRDGERLEVRVSDDGSGIAPDAPWGVGRPSMAERAVELGGHLDVDSAPGAGTAVRAVLPVRTP